MESISTLNAKLLVDPLFFTAPSPSAGVVADSIHSWGGKEGLDIVRARANSMRNATGKGSTGNWESHLCGHCPSASTPGSGHLRASAAWLRATGFHLVWLLGGGWGVAAGDGRWKQRKRPGYFFPQSLPPQCPWTPPVPPRSSSHGAR